MDVGSAAGSGDVDAQSCPDRSSCLGSVQSHCQENGPQRNYTTREQELLAIKEALRVWRHDTMAVPVEVKTDHDSTCDVILTHNLT
eukprot:3012406-Rhodomonas_salina.1